MAGRNTVPTAASSASPRSTATSPRSAGLGYPPFAHLRKHDQDLNPALVVVGALAHSDLEVRIVEALPWVLATFDDLDAEWLVAQCRVLNLQNRLGYLVALALQVKGTGAVTHLELALEELRKSKLVHESTLCRESMAQAERTWVRQHRSVEATEWALLTTLSADQLNYAA